jgi:hypothetical protein
MRVYLWKVETKPVEDSLREPVTTQAGKGKGIGKYGGKLVPQRLTQESACAMQPCLHRLRSQAE